MSPELSAAFSDAFLKEDKDEVLRLVKLDSELANAVILKYGSPPLFLTYSGAEARLLISHGADTEARSDGLTPLLSAIKRQAVEVVPVLIESGADVNADDGYGHSPLIYAIVSCKKAIVDMLLEAGASYGLKEASLRHDLGRVTDILANDPEAVQKLSPQEQVRLLDNTLSYVEPQYGGVGSKAEAVETVRHLFRNGLSVPDERLLCMASEAYPELKEVLLQRIRSGSRDSE